MKIRSSLLLSLLVTVAFTLALVVPSRSGHREAQAQIPVNGTQIFLQLPGIEGTAMTKGFEKQIPLLSAATGVRAEPKAKPVPGDLAIAKRVDNASPLLFLTAANGKHLASATVTVLYGSSQAVYKLTDVSITSYQTSASAGAEPQEALTLTYAKFELEVRAPSAKGTPQAPTRAGYDFAQNKPL